MQVFKFGGASVSSAPSIKNAAEIIRMFPGPKVIVISAMGKTTNTLEELVRAYYHDDPRKTDILETVRKYHDGIMQQLAEGHPVDYSQVDILFRTLEDRLDTAPSMNFDYEYDQVVSYGELISTAIISSFYNSTGLDNQWIDIRKYLITDDIYRDAAINWELSEKQVKKAFDCKKNELIITQGFLGGTTTNHTTTLGREGSDYTAAILANILDAQDVTIWKNVPGILNADPDFLPATQKLDELSYREAIELSYSGAKIIHPKTIKPLQNKHIPLFVKSFDNPEKEGTIIHNIDHPLELVPVFINKERQALITLTPADFSFISIHTVSGVFSLVARYRLRVSLIQQSALNLSLAFDEPEQGVEELIAELKKLFEVRYNTGLELVTIRYYNQEAIDRITNGHQVYIEQKSRRTARLLFKRS
ncbi:MAG: aspartate kinase [Prolixibacteraceae bacterium]|jgi:aspartate kinase|nr:aspartate kinase [Prolixibacteraceae bacterium]